MPGVTYNIMRPQLVIQGVNIVLRGKFNPAMFHPAWFAAQNLIRQQEVEVAEIKIIHPDAAIFDVEWLQIRVTRNRFQAASVQEAYYEALRDVVIGVFTILNQTPLKAMGINREFHYGLESEKARNAVGHRPAAPGFLARSQDDVSGRFFEHVYARILRPGQICSCFHDLA